MVDVCVDRAKPSLSSYIAGSLCRWSSGARAHFLICASGKVLCGVGRRIRPVSPPACGRLKRGIYSVDKLWQRLSSARYMNSLMKGHPAIKSPGALFL